MAKLKINCDEEIDKENRLNEKITLLNNCINRSANILKGGNNIFKLCPNERKINNIEIKPRDLINVALRVNTNYSAPFGDSNVLPESYKNPYPIEDKEMKKENTILKFNLDKKVLNPIIKPEENFVVKGTPLELNYPDINEQDVYFKYTLDDSLPTFFSGIKVINYTKNILFYSI